MQTHPFKQYPILDFESNQTLIGTVSNIELSLAMETQSLNDTTMISFIHSPEHVDFSRYVDFTPITVFPETEIEFIIDIFKSVGPKCILVENDGKLLGLITKKDLLRHLNGNRDDFLMRSPSLENESQDISVWDKLKLYARRLFMRRSESLYFELEEL